MNNIFSKNLSALCQKNLKLAEKLKTYIPLEVPQLIQTGGSYNIQYRGKLIHNPQNPLGEAKEVFSFAENTPVAIHLVYGLGLGYLFQVASLNSKGTVILYEPDLNILWIAFTLVDFSSDILKENVFVCSEYEEVQNAIYKKSGMKNSPQMLSVPSQREFNPTAFEELVKNLQNLVGSFSLDLKYTKEKFYPSLKMLLKNVPQLMEELPLARFKDFYKGKTAVVVSAGPTLDRNIETLKKYRDNYILFTVGTAVKTLYSHGIKPDFLCIIETYDSSRQIEGLDLSDVNFITEPYSNPALRNFKFKQRFSHISANTPVNHFWAEICGENIEEYWSKGTVSYTALNCARLLGCSKIILVGQDLAYIEGQCYSKDSAYKDLICEYNSVTNRWEITAKDLDKFASAISPSENYEIRIKTAKNRLERLNNSLYYVKGINGDMLPTESVYAAFVTPLKEFAENFNNRTYINTSLVGAQIDRFENLPLDEALKDSVPISNLDLVGDFSYDREKIFDNLRNKLVELKGALTIIQEGKQYAKSLNNDIKRYRNVGAEVLKSLKKLSVCYLSLSGEFADRSKMFDYITTADKIDLDYEMKMIQNFTVENVTRICDKICTYMQNAENRINEIERLINESINTKS